MKIRIKKVNETKYNLEITCSCGEVYNYCSYHDYPDQCPNCGNNSETMIRINE